MSAEPAARDGDRSLKNRTALARPWLHAEVDQEDWVNHQL
jgi:hypothetical protein